MAVKFLSTNKAKLFGLVIVVGFVVIVVLVLTFPNSIRLKRIREETNRLERGSKALELEINDYQNKIQEVKKDSYIYEKIARDDLGVARENEIVIDIE